MGVWVLAMLLGGTVLGPELEHCRLGAVVFASSDVGIVTDRCGKLFMTMNGGRTWTDRSETVPIERGFLGQSLTEGIALDDGTLILAGYVGKRVFRSTNWGRTWNAVTTPSEQFVYAMSARGAHVWACGSAGEIMTSGDRGLTWNALAHSPTNGDDRCGSLDFFDSMNGWVGGTKGTLWSTSDGGLTWTPVPTPAGFDEGVSAVVRPAITRVIRVNARRGFIAGPPGTFRTSDGGKTWKRLQLRHSAKAVVTTLGPHRVLGSAGTTSLRVEEQWVELLPRLAARGTGAVAILPDGIGLWDADGTRRIISVSGPSTTAPPRPETIRAAGNLQIGTNDRRAFISYDDGFAWRELAPLPNELPFERFAVLGRRALASSGRSTFRSDDLGRTWRVTESSLDAHDLSLALGLAADDPMSCLMRGTNGSLTAELEKQGCFGGSKSTLRFSWDERGGDVVKPGTGEATRLSRAEVRRSLEALHALLTRPEESSGCTSTTVTKATVEVKCTVDQSTRTQTVKLETRDCGDEWDDGETSSAAPAGHARAAAVYRWATGR